MTESEYPRFVKFWKRGENLLDLGKPLFEAAVSDVSAGFSIQHKRKIQLFEASHEFFASKKYIRLENQPLIPLLCDESCSVQSWGNYLLFKLRSDYAGHGGGSLLAAKVDDFLQFGESALRCVFSPTSKRVLENFTATRDFVLCSVLNNVLPEVLALKPNADGTWSETKVQVPGLGSVTLVSLWDEDDESSDTNSFLLYYCDFLVPSTVFLYRDASAKATTTMELTSPLPLMGSPVLFDSSGCKVEQRHATSKDGTLVPYFLVLPSNFDQSAPVPALIDVYGGFDASMLPFYSGGVGRCWIEKGGAFVLGNVRGGGEFGPTWHKCAIREKRQRVFDDVAAIAEALHRDGVSGNNFVAIVCMFSFSFCF